MLKFIRDFILFVTIFSFINDNLMVDFLGAASLKIVFALFVAVNIIDIAKATIHTPPNSIMKTYNIFIIVFSIVTMLVSIMGMLPFMDGLMTLVGIHVVFIFFSYYRDFDRLLYFIWFSVLVSAISSLFHDPIAEFTFRITGGTADPVEFSVHLFMAIFITIFLYNKNKNIIFLVGSIALFLYAMLYAGSKTAILTIAIVSVYALFVRFRYILKSIFSFKGLLAFVFLGILISQTSIGDKLNNAIQGIEQRTATSSETLRTAETRFAAWEAGAGMIEDYFFTGVGVNQFSEHVKNYLKVTFNDIGLLNPHNILVKIFTEAGVFSFLSFLLFLYFLIKSRHGELLRTDYFWISLIPLAVIIMGMALNITYKKHLWLAFALWANVMMVYFTNDNEENA